MSKSRLTRQFTLNNWNKFSKDFKKKYKEENNKPLEINTAVYITFYKVIGLNKRGLREPEIEDVVTLIKLGNNNCTDDEAITILSNYLSDESVTGGLIGAMLDIIIDFYTDLNISKEFTARALELKNVYIDSTKEDEENKSDTQE